MPWSPPIGSQILPVHAALLHTGERGEVLLFGGNQFRQYDDPTTVVDAYMNTRVYDVHSHSLVAIPNVDHWGPSSDVFCSGHAFLPGGVLLVAGGTSTWVPEEGSHHTHHPDKFIGHRRCWLFDPRRERSKQWCETSQLLAAPGQLEGSKTGGRWYPTVVTLGDGTAVAFMGHPEADDERHRNVRPERFLPGSDVWVVLPRDVASGLLLWDNTVRGPRPLYYPRVFTLPSGLLFFATPMPVAFDASADGEYFSTLYDPSTGAYVEPRIAAPVEEDPLPEAPNGSPNGYMGYHYPAVLLPLLPEERYRARVLFCGGLTPQKIDLGAAAMAWTPTSPRTEALRHRRRLNANAVLLPTGEVCVLGGMHDIGGASSRADPVNDVELYQPGIDWQTGQYSVPDRWRIVDGYPHSDEKYRSYHSIALLLPNGKVLVGGGQQRVEVNDHGFRDLELYEPPYVASRERLRLHSAPGQSSYNQRIRVEVDRPHAVRRAALLRNGSTTHAFDADQRYVGVKIVSRDANGVVLEMPPNGWVAPPGYYMLWLIADGEVPCEHALFIHLGASAPSAPRPVQGCDADDIYCKEVCSKYCAIFAELKVLIKQLKVSPLNWKLMSKLSQRLWALVTVAFAAVAAGCSCSCK